MDEDKLNSGAVPGVDPMQPTVDQNITVPSTQQSAVQSMGHKGFNWKMFLMIIGGVVVGIILVIVIVFVVTSINSKKFECISSQGNITIMYSDDAINGYVASGISYDLDGQKSIAELIGIPAYLEEFNNWFTANTDGVCVEK